MEIWRFWKTMQKISKVFLNLLRPRKLASRPHEKQILRKLSKKKWYFFEICNFGKWSSRVGESKIFMNKYKNFTKTNMFTRCRFLRDVSAKMKIFKKIIVWKVHFSGPKREVKMGSKSVYFLSDFSGSFFLRPFWPGAHFSKDVSCETPIFKTSFSKFSLEKGFQNEAKIDIKMTTKIDEIFSAFWSCLGGPQSWGNMVKLG